MDFMFLISHTELLFENNTAIIHYALSPIKGYGCGHLAKQKSKKNTELPNQLLKFGNMNLKIFH